ncbi:MAG: hypothetical protein RPR97_14335 [Colwellia sp.]
MKWFSLILILFLCGCVSTDIQKSERISVDIQGAIYNSITNQYVPQMTQVEIHSSKEGELANLITIYVDRYGAGRNFLYIDSVHINDHILAVDKYLKWEEIAKAQNDKISKEITNVPSKYITHGLDYSFFSGNTESHYLVVDNAPSFATKGQYAIYFDKENAIKYKNILISFKNNKFRLKHLSDIYK